MHSIGSRLKVWREAIGLKQADAAALLSLSGSTYQNYERDVRAPNTEGWEAFCRAGINTNWLLTNEGPMLLKDLQPAPLKINVPALAAILSGATQGLPGASTEDIADFAVKMYMDALERGLITPDGVGKGNLNAAA